MVLHTVIFWSLYEAGGINLEKGVTLINQGTNELSLKGEMLQIIMQNIQPVRGRMWTWEEAGLKSQGNHPLMMMQICIWELKAVSETAEGATETMVHPSGLLETTPSDCLGYNFWLCHQNLTGSKEPADERREVFVMLSQKALKF